MKFKKFFLYSVIILAFAYISICIYMYAVQRNILYRPHVIRPPLVENLNAKIQEVEIPSTDNVKLKSWFYKNNQNKYTVLFYMEIMGI